MNANQKSTRRFRRRLTPKRGHEPEIVKPLNALVASIHDQTFDNELNVGQIKIIREHLYHALVVGYELAL